MSSCTITQYGTDIGNALTVAANVFDRETRHKTIILLSDGEDLEEEGIRVAQRLASEGVVIYTIGIGSPEGAPILVLDNRGREVYATDDRGNVVITRLDVIGLHRIAEVTGGQFYMITPAYSEIYEILRLIQDNERTRYATRQLFRYKEQYHYFLILALFLIILEGIINYKQRRKYIS